MEPVITAAESRRLDTEATESLDVLMDRAGLAVALATVEMGATYGRRVAVLAGKGNNGGDGYVAARHLRGRGVAVTVYALDTPAAGTVAVRARDAAFAAGVPIVPLADPLPADLVVDALFGSGFRGDLPAPLLPWLDHPGPVLGVDLASGLDADTGNVATVAFVAERTVTFHARKVGHLIGQGPRHSGQVTVVDIGLTDEIAEFLIVDAASAPRPRRARTDHKWSTGSVLVVGGAPGMSGAPLLAARSALRFGAGAVRLVVPGSVVERVASAAPEIMVSSTDDEVFATRDASDIAGMADRFDVLVLGPGLGVASDGFVRALLDLWDGPRVIDADALGAVASPKRLAGPKTVITPHAGEWRRLTGLDATYSEAREARADLDLTVLLKGSPTFVVAEEVVAVTTGGPELATIGTGDVLAGMVGALMARGLDGAAAARSGAYWHGIAGAELARSGTVTADRLLEEIVRFAW